MTTFYLAPGTYPQEIDFSGQVQAISTSIGAVTFASRKGPVELTSITGGVNQFNNLYGFPDPTWSFGHYTCLAFLITAKILWCQRVVNNATYAGLVVTNDYNGALATTTSMVPFPSGRFNNYQNGAQQVQNLVFSGPLLTLNVVNVSITNGTTQINATATFSGSSDATLAALAGQIATLINSTYAISMEALGGASVIPVAGTTGSSNNVITIIAPQGVNLTISTPVVTLGASQATVLVENDPWLFEVYAQNPGGWGNSTGISINNVSQGVRQRLSVSFSAVLITGNTFNSSINVNGVSTAIIPVTFTTNNNNTMALILAAYLQAIGPGADGWVVAGGSNNLQIVLVAPKDGPNVMTIENAVVTAGASQASVAVAQVLTGVSAVDTFQIWVFTTANSLVPVEKFTVSLNQQVDGFGSQQFIEEVINNQVNSTTGVNGSSYIRINYNNMNTAGVLAGLSALTTNNIMWLNGGNDGALPTDSQINLGWASFTSRSQVAVNLLLNAGYTSPLVQQNMATIAQNRYDCFAILDMPSDSQSSTAAVTYRTTTLDVNNNYAAIYTPDFLITDNYSNMTLYVPPSGYVGAVFAYNDAVAASWFAPAGLTRGIIPNVQGLRVSYTDGDQQLLFPNQINYILLKDNSYVVWGAETLQSMPSALSNINVRRLLITVEVSLVDALDYTIWQPDDPYTRFQVVQLCTNFLQPIKENRGLTAYQVICDDSNNGAYYEDMGQLNVAILLKPIIPVKFIQLTSVVTTQGAAFSEVIALLNL